MEIPLRLANTADLKTINERYAEVDLDWIYTENNRKSILIKLNNS